MYYFDTDKLISSSAHRGQSSVLHPSTTTIRRADARGYPHLAQRPPSSRISRLYSRNGRRHSGLFCLPVHPTYRFVPSVTSIPSLVPSVHGLFSVSNTYIVYTADFRDVYASLRYVPSTSLNCSGLSSFPTILP